MDYEKNGTPFKYVNVLQNRDDLNRMLQLTNGVREVPVIFENGKVTIGYNGGS